MTSCSRFVLCLYLVQLTSGCSFVPGKEPRRYATQEVLYLAPIVVSGTVVELDETHNEATLNITCVYKTDDVNMSTTVVIIEGARRTSCDGTRDLEGNHTYLVALEEASGDDEGKYAIAEPESLARAAWIDGDLGLDIVASICDIAPANVTLSDPDFVQDCPRLPDLVECFVISGSWRGVTVHTGVVVVLWLTQVLCILL